MVSNLCPPLRDFSDTFCVEKDIQNYAFRSLVEAYGRTMVRSDRMDLSWGQYSLTAIDPVLRLLNRVCRAPYSLQPVLFAFEVDTEMEIQIRHFVTEFQQSIARIEAKTVSIQSHTLKQSLDNAYIAFERFQSRVNEKRAYNGYKYIRFIPNSWRPEGMQILDSYYDFATLVMKQLKALEASLNSYDVDVAEMQRQHKTLLVHLATVRHFEMERTGLIWIPSQSSDTSRMFPSSTFKTPPLNNRTAPTQTRPILSTSIQSPRHQICQRSGRYWSRFVRGRKTPKSFPEACTRHVSSGDISKQYPHSITVSSVQCSGVGALSGQGQSRSIEWLWAMTPEPLLPQCTIG